MGESGPGRWFVGLCMRGRRGGGMWLWSCQRCTKVLRQLTLEPECAMRRECRCVRRGLDFFCNSRDEVCYDSEHDEEFLGA